jgi:hypothetical protein
MKIEMTKKKTTKNTVVYSAEGTAIPTLYIQKSGLDGEPETIQVEIKVLEGDLK